MNKLVSLTAILVLCSSLSAHAEEPFAGEAEAGAIVVSGNNNSESYNAKAKSIYTHDQNIYTAFGRYLKTNSNGLESARNWEAGLRYERELAEYLGLFVGQKAESDVYNGYTQRDSSDAGLKYSFVKTDELNWFFETGYRYQKTQPVTGVNSYDNLGRLYMEYNQVLNDTLSLKYWAEYLPNFTVTDAFLANTEGSLNIMLNSVFSLKLAYLLQYQNVPASGGKYTTTTTTMNLVAKF